MDTGMEVRWRLRNGTQIVGYERRLNGQNWSSTDGFWWNGAALEYSEKDRCLMSKDANNQWLFEGDVVTSRAKKGPWILRYLPKGWRLVRTHEDSELPPNSRDLKRIAFAFVK